MELLRDTNFDFMKYRKFWVVVSLALVALGIVSVFFMDKLNYGVDFVGGTQVTLKFRDQPDLQALRGLLPQDANIQRFGREGDNEVIIRTRLEEGAQTGSRDAVVTALDRRYNQERGAKVDLNRVGAEQVRNLLAASDPERRGADAAPAHYLGIAESILEKRRDVSLFDSWDDLAGVPGVSPGVMEVLQRRAHLGDFAVLGVEEVGPQIGRELRQKGLLAVLMSMIGMLVYIWFRFELRFGVGAIMACIHDILVTLGFFALADYEFNLTTVAAFLTLIGYSVNDTVVIFDRIRENMRKSRREPLITVMNRSINQTLSRTILTGGSTLLVLACLYVWGGDVIKGFAFVLLVGILVGTYSSIYVASPFALLWEQVFGNRRRAGGTASTGDAAADATARPRVETPRASARSTTTAGRR